MNKLTPEQVLDLPMQQPNDANATTIRDYLVKIVAEVWREGEGFSGKRPFGNSCWHSDLFVPLVKAGVISGRFDEEGFLEDSDDAAGDKLITEAIKALNQQQDFLTVRLEGTQVAVSVEGEHVVFADRVDPANLARIPHISRRQLRLMQAILVEALTNINAAIGSTKPQEE